MSEQGKVQGKETTVFAFVGCLIAVCIVPSLLWELCKYLPFLASLWTQRIATGPKSGEEAETPKTNVDAQAATGLSTQQPDYASLHRNGHSTGEDGRMRHFVVHVMEESEQEQKEEKYEPIVHHVVQVNDESESDEKEASQEAYEGGDEEIVYTAADLLREVYSGYAPSMEPQTREPTTIELGNDLPDLNQYHNEQIQDTGVDTKSNAAKEEKDEKDEEPEKEFFPQSPQTSNLSSFDSDTDDSRIPALDEWLAKLQSHGLLAEDVKEEYCNEKESTEEKQADEKEGTRDASEEDDEKKTALSEEFTDGIDILESLAAESDEEYVEEKWESECRTMQPMSLHQRRNAYRMPDPDEDERFLTPRRGRGVRPPPIPGMLPRRRWTETLERIRWQTKLTLAKQRRGPYVPRSTNTWFMSDSAVKARRESLSRYFRLRKLAAEEQARLDRQMAAMAVYAPSEAKPSPRAEEKVEEEEDVAHSPVVPRGEHDIEPPSFSPVPCPEPMSIVKSEYSRRGPFSTKHTPMSVDTNISPRTVQSMESVVFPLRTPLRQPKEDIQVTSLPDFDSDFDSDSNSVALDPLHVSFIQEAYDASDDYLTTKEVMRSLPF